MSKQKQQLGPFERRYKGEARSTELRTDLDDELDVWFIVVGNRDSEVCLGPDELDRLIDDLCDAVARPRPPARGASPSECGYVGCDGTHANHPAPEHGFEVHEGNAGVPAACPSVHPIDGYPCEREYGHPHGHAYTGIGGRVRWTDPEERFSVSRRTDRLPESKPGVTQFRSASAIPPAGDPGSMDDPGLYADQSTCPACSDLVEAVCAICDRDDLFEGSAARERREYVLSKQDHRCPDCGEDTGTNASAGTAVYTNFPCGNVREYNRGVVAHTGDCDRREDRLPICNGHTGSGDDCPGCNVCRGELLVVLDGFDARGRATSPPMREMAPSLIPEEELAAPDQATCPACSDLTEAVCAICDRDDLFEMPDD